MEDDCDSFTTGESISSNWYPDAIDESKYGDDPEPLVSQRTIEIEQLRRLRKLNERRFLHETQQKSSSQRCQGAIDPAMKEQLKLELDEKLRRLDAEEMELQKQMNRLFKDVEHGGSASSRREPVQTARSLSSKLLLCKGAEGVAEPINSRVEDVVAELKRLVQTLRRETWMTVVVERVEDMPDYSVRALQRQHARDKPIHRNLAVRVRVSPCLTHLEWKTSDGAVYQVEIAHIAAIFCGDSKEAIQMGVKAQHIFRLHIAEAPVPLQFAASNETLRNDWVSGLALIQYLSPLGTLGAS